MQRLSASELTINKRQYSQFRYQIFLTYTKEENWL